MEKFVRKEEVDQSLNASMLATLHTRLDTPRTASLHARSAAFRSDLPETSNFSMLCRSSDEGSVSEVHLL